MSIFGVDEEGLIICPTEEFAGASSLTATASPSEALRFFLDFFSAVQECIIMCDKAIGMRSILMRLGVGTERPRAKRISHAATQNPSNHISIRRYCTTSFRHTHPNLPYFDISKRRKGILHEMLDTLLAGRLQYKRTGGCRDNGGERPATSCCRFDGQTKTFGAVRAGCGADDMIMIFFTRRGSVTGINSETIPVQDVRLAGLRSG